MSRDFTVTGCLRNHGNSRIVLRTKRYVHDKAGEGACYIKKFTALEGGCFGVCVLGMPGPCEHARVIVRVRRKVVKLWFGGIA